jgi:dihydrofolate reductase
MPPTKPIFRAYLAVSLDGYIADHAGGVKWLDRYNDPSLGFEKFDRSIDTIIVGRTTFDQARAWGTWDNLKKRVIVLTRRPLKDLPARVETFRGDVRKLARQLARDGAKQVWLMGGGESLKAFHKASLVDRWELFFIPTLLHKGIPLFPPNKPGVERLTLVRCKKHNDGIVELHYEPAR